MSAIRQFRAIHDFDIDFLEEVAKKREQRKNQVLNGYNRVRTMTENEIKSSALFIPFRKIFNIGTLYISFLPNTWGDSAVIRTVDDDILKLKKWVELNPIF